MISGTVAGTTLSRNYGGRGLFRRAGFAPQESIGGGGYDATFIPSYQQGNEWQGTVVANRYDEYGNHLEQRTHNVTAIDWGSNGNWEVIFEVSYQNGDSWLAWEDGMLDDQYYQWGTAFYTQPNATTYQQEVGPTRERPVLEEQISGLGKPAFTRAGFTPTAGGATFKRAAYRAPQAGDRSAAYRYDPRNPTAPRGYIYSPVPPQVRTFATNSFWGCAGAAAACRIAGPWTFACAGGWCVGAAVSQLPVLFR